MIRTVALAAALVLAGVAADAADDEVDCSKASTQYDMDICANKDFDAADKKLNNVYGQAVKVAGDLDDKTLDKLRTAERAWLAFREAECTFETADYEGGTIYPMTFTMCRTKLTRTRTKELEAYLACEKDTMKC
ncbi:MAG: DUF1311 domain-containing protein [Alphaproteobacteria bacterium]|nr:DUF1311 domain-containing protein [Alphaproteobacteria bacterium]